jgi:hypothetical protein
MGKAVERLRAAVERYQALLVDPAPPRAEVRIGLSAAGTSLARVLAEQLLFRESAATASRLLAEIGEADDVPAAWLRLRAASATYLFTDEDADIQRPAIGVLAIAERDGARELALEARLALLTLSSVTPQDMLAETLHVLELARELGRSDVEGRTLRLRAGAVMEQDGDPTEALEVAAAFAVSRGLDEQLGWVDYLRVENAFRTGDWDAAYEAALRAIELGERHEYHRIVVRTWHTFVPVAAARGDHAMLERASRWHAAHESFFPRSPYGLLHRAASDVPFWRAGLIPEPVLAPEELLPSFTAGGMTSWFESADVVVHRWIELGLVEAAATAAERLQPNQLPYASASSRAAVSLMLGRARLATGDRVAAADAGRRAVELARAGDAPWWQAKALRLVQRAGSATAADVAAAAAIESRLGAVAPAW